MHPSILSQPLGSPIALISGVSSMSLSVSASLSDVTAIESVSTEGDGFNVFEAIGKVIKVAQLIDYGQRSWKAIITAWNEFEIGEWFW